MGLRDSRDSAWLPAYRAERDGLLLDRVRLAIGLILPAVAAITLHASLTNEGELPARLLVALPFLVVSLLGWSASRASALGAHGFAIALGFVLLTGAATIAAWFALPQEVALVPVYLVSLMMASTLLFPWGAGPQVIVCAVLLGGYALILARTPAAVADSAFVVAATMVPVTLAGAARIELARRTTFERTWQKDQLASLAQDLADHVETDRVLATVLEHGLRLLECDAASAMLADPARHVLRIAALVGQRVDRSWVGFEVAEDFASARLVTTGSVLALPDDDPDNPFVAVLRDSGMHRALYLPLRQAGSVLGILGFARERNVPFTAAERRLAHAIAHQGSLALHTARVVADLRRVGQLKTEFVSTMSHELRTPLNVILGYAEMARDAAAGGLPVTGYLEHVENAGRELLTLIESTLEIGRLEANRDLPQLEDIAVPVLWAALQGACAQLPRTPGVRVDWGAAAPAVMVRTDPRKLAVIVRNLVGNALKFTERGQVTVQASADAAGLRLSVADTGIGIRPEAHEAIFEMFRQGDSSDSRRYGGTGLGLYIARRFAEQIGGRITLESTAGQGATFTVTLPVTAQAAAA